MKNASSDGDCWPEGAELYWGAGAVCPAGAPEATIGYTVIAEETGVGSLGKIPGVCSAMKVACINLMPVDRRGGLGVGLGRCARRSAGSAPRSPDQRTRHIEPHSHQILAYPVNI